VTLRSGSGPTAVTDGMILMGESATCGLCHQGRNSAASTYKKVRGAGTDPYGPSTSTITNVQCSDFDTHHGLQAASLFSAKGWEYRGKAYSPGNLMHQNMGCVGCHMLAGEDDSRGGHTMKPAGCERCHGTDFEEFEEVGRQMDLDGDGVLGYPKAELESLRERVIEALAASGVYFNEAKRPYCFTTSDPAAQANGTATKNWQTKQLLAAYNIFYVGGDGAFHVHNLRYAVQLLRDSYEELTSTTLGGARLSTGDDRPARDYSTP
jgi:hypothetical protein